MWHGRAPVASGDGDGSDALPERSVGRGFAQAVESQPTDGMTATRVTIRHVLNFPVCVENRGLADTDKVDPAPPARTGSVPISPAGTPFSGDPAARAGYRIPDQNR